MTKVSFVLFVLIFGLILGLPANAGSLVLTPTGLKAFNEENPATLVPIALADVLKMPEWNGSKSLDPNAYIRISDDRTQVEVRGRNTRGWVKGRTQTEREQSFVRLDRSQSKMTKVLHAWVSSTNNVDAPFVVIVGEDSNESKVVDLYYLNDKTATHWELSPLSGQVDIKIHQAWQSFATSLETYGIDLLTEGQRLVHLDLLETRDPEPTVVEKDLLRLTGTETWVGGIGGNTYVATEKNELKCYSGGRLAATYSMPEKILGIFDPGQGSTLADVKAVALQYGVALSSQAPLIRQVSVLPNPFPQLGAPEPDAVIGIDKSGKVFQLSADSDGTYHWALATEQTLSIHSLNRPSGTFKNNNGEMRIDPQGGIFFRNQDFGVSSPPQWTEYPQGGHHFTFGVPLRQNTFILAEPQSTEAEGNPFLHPSEWRFFKVRIENRSFRSEEIPLGVPSRNSIRPSDGQIVDIETDAYEIKLVTHTEVIHIPKSKLKGQFIELQPTPLGLLVLTTKGVEALVTNSWDLKYIKPKNISETVSSQEPGAAEKIRIAKDTVRSGISGPIKGKKLTRSGRRGKKLPLPSEEWNSTVLVIGDDGSLVEIRQLDSLRWQSLYANPINSITPDLIARYSLRGTRDDGGNRWEFVSGGKKIRAYKDGNSSFADYELFSPDKDEDENDEVEWGGGTNLANRHGDVKPPGPFTLSNKPESASYLALESMGLRGYYISGLYSEKGLLALWDLNFGNYYEPSQVYWKTEDASVPTFKKLKPYSRVTPDAGPTGFGAIGLDSHGKIIDIGLAEQNRFSLVYSMDSSGKKLELQIPQKKWDSPHFSVEGSDEQIIVVEELGQIEPTLYEDLEIVGNSIIGLRSDGVINIIGNTKWNHKSVLQYAFSDVYLPLGFRPMAFVSSDDANAWQKVLKLRAIMKLAIDCGRQYGSEKEE